MGASGEDALMETPRFDDTRRAPMLTLSLGLLVLMLVAVMYPAVFDGPDSKALRDLGLLVLPERAAVQPFALVDQHGEEFGLAQLEGQWTLLFFGFASCPDVCPTTLAKLKKATAGLENAPRVVFVTVDPARDSAELLGQYLEAFDSAFVGLRGSAFELDGFAAQFHVDYAVAPGVDGKYLMEHTAQVVVLDDQPRHVGFLMTPHRPEAIRAALQAVL